MNLCELYQCISKFYIDIWNIGKNYYDKLVSQGLSPEIAEKIVQECINKTFRKTFNF